MYRGEQVDEITHVDTCESQPKVLERLLEAQRLEEHQPELLEDYIQSIDLNEQQLYLFPMTKDL